MAALFPARAQWTQENYPLEGGWNAVWLSLDCSHIDLPALVEGQGDILEVWQWNPLGSTTQFTESPWLPVQADAAWKVWRRGDPGNSTLLRMTGNAGYLVKVTTGRAPFVLSLTGRPLLPKYEFATTGSNFVGFPVVDPPSVVLRSFERFFSFSEVLKANPPVFAYQNGPLSSLYPVQTLPRTTAVQRGRAYWVKNSTYTDYYGPLKLTLLGTSIDFGPVRNTVSLRVKNVVDRAKEQTVTAVLTPAASAVAPAGQPAVAGAVPLQVRGPRDAATLEFTYTPLPAEGLTLSLAPGEEKEVVFAIDRSAMGGTPGSVYQSLLSITDSLELTRMVLPVRAETTSFAGIWAGAAVVSTVDQILGQQVTPNANAPATLAIRLLMHRKENGETTLLQQAFVGERLGDPVAGTNEATLKALASSPPGRLTTASFPVGMIEAGTGSLGQTGPLSFQVDLGYNAPTNPFVHSYHPDHDNLDARFESLLGEGKESFTVRRAVSLQFLASLPGFSEPGWGSTTLGGTYKEVLTGLRTQPLTVTGTFLLHRVSAAPVLVP